ncbi:hypothetical protein [Miltoncostaea oceani]|jgi:hypothetical protein|uniref:hypothetical protein n=1 Tax=Miltoncostaea oceani TaxID=2843216 RepID=UPI001C3DA8C0|nr:hypothetical protein [Miltoncostaea oceani]
MDMHRVMDMGAERARHILDDVAPPALMPLPRIPVSAEVWEGERHVRLHGEAIYAVHRGAEAWWMVVVQESNTLAAGCLRLTRTSEISCESASGRRGG